MFDVNGFKKQTKKWMLENPNGSLEEFVDYCEELIPTAQYSSYYWLLEQSANWYRYILSQREIAASLLQDNFN